MVKGGIFMDPLPMDKTQIQVLDNMTLAEAQAKASNIKNLDDPYDEEVRKVVYGDNYQSLLPPSGSHIVSSDGLRTNLEVNLERGIPMAQEISTGEICMKAPNGKIYSMDDLTNCMALMQEQAKNDPNFARMQQASRNDPPPTDKEGFFDWLLDHKIYVAGGIALAFFAWWIYNNFFKNGGAEVDMADAALAFCEGC